MPYKEGTRFRCETHNRTFLSNKGLSIHWSSKHPGEPWNISEHVIPPGAPEDLGPGPGEVTFPPLREWEAGRSKEEAQPRAPLPTQGAPPPIPPAAPATMDTTRIWVALSRIIDKTLLNEPGDVRTNVDEALGKELDAAVKNAGLYVVPNVEPILIPWWVPLGTLIGGVFILPVIAKFAPKLVERLGKAVEEATSAPAPEVAGRTERFAPERST